MGLSVLQRLPELAQQQNGAAGGASATAAGAAGHRSPGGAALERLERQLEAEARSSQAFRSRLLHSVTGRFRLFRPPHVPKAVNPAGAGSAGVALSSASQQRNMLGPAAAGPGSATATGPSASNLTAAHDGAAGHEPATDEGLEAAVAAEVDAASGLTMRLRELCAL
jgi:hypothetical protein